MKKYIILLAFLTTGVGLMAQQPDTSKKASSTDALMNSLSTSTDSTKQPVIAFRSTRLILSQTTETVKKKTLNFLIIHRFGDFAGKSGGGQFDWGLDDVADVYLGFEYGLTDNLNVDFGRSTIGRLVNIDLKYAILHQTTDNSTPISFTLFGESGINTYGAYNTFSDRLSYFAQAIISKQFGSNFSLQVSPGYITENIANPTLVPGNNDLQFFTISAAARLKVTKHMSLVVDYAHPFSTFRNGANGFSDPLGFGIEIESGGHVFTINISNPRAVSALNYFSNTQTDFGKGQYRLGFTISRIFDFNHKSSYK
jgi:hypothetical protein